MTFQAIVRESITNEPVEGLEFWNWRQPEIEGVSNADGLIEIPGMMAGEFEFNVTAVVENRKESSFAGEYARWWSEQATKDHQHEEKQPVQFQRNFDSLSFDLQGEVTRVEVFVEPLVTIRGRVIDPHGNPVEGATVAPAKTGSGNSITGDTRYSYLTDVEGMFTIKLPASKTAKYNLVAHDGKYGQWRTWANGVGEPFQTTPGQVIEDVVLQLTEPATVRGQVMNVLGTPRSHVKVRAAAVDKRDNRCYHPQTETDEEGKYELKYIRPGKQYIQIEPIWLDAVEASGETTRIVDLQPNSIEENVNFQTD